MPDRYTIAIPMAGYGTRMRPHTWSKPKPLIQLADKTVLDHVLDQFASLPGIHNAEWVFIISQGQQVLVQEHMQRHHPGKTVHYVVQEVMKGQSDALYLAREYLQGPMLMSFSDTLIETDLSFLPKVKHDGVAWVKAVPDPRRFGVAEVDKDGWVTRLVEKPRDIENNRAVVGFYFFRSGKDLMSAIEEQMKRGVSLNGEYFLTDTINVLLEKGAHFSIKAVETWLDAGTRDSLLETNRYLLEHGHGSDAKVHIRNGVKIIPPVYIPTDVEITSGSIGPHVSLGHGVHLINANLSDTIIEAKTRVEESTLTHSHIGRNSTIKGARGKVNIGDDSWVEL
jgi:glucose-1-phosphate thymidylyltransferase